VIILPQTKDQGYVLERIRRLGHRAYSWHVSDRTVCEQLVALGLVHEVEVRNEAGEPAGWYYQALDA